MATLKTLAADMKSAAVQLPEIAGRGKKVIATAVLKSLIDSAPVDTSLFVSNWQVGTEPGGEVPPYSLGTKGSTRAASAASALATGLRVIQSAPRGVPIVVFNPVKYGRYLNDGTSTRPALGFVERAILVGRQTLKKLKVRFGR